MVEVMEYGVDGQVSGMTVRRAEEPEEVKRRHEIMQYCARHNVLNECHCAEYIVIANILEK